MSDLLPGQTRLRVVQTTGLVTRKALAGLDHLIIIVPRAAGKSVWQRIPDGASLQDQLQRIGSGDAMPFLRSRLGNPVATGVTLAKAPKPPPGAAQSSTFALLRFAGELVTDALQANPRRLGIQVAGFDNSTTAKLINVLVLAAGAGRFHLPEYRSKSSPRSRLTQVNLLGLHEKLDIDRVLAEDEALNLVRWLTAMPPNKLSASGYREAISALSEHNDWSMRFLDIAALRRLGAGAFLAVAQGNAGADAGVIHLSWRPRGRRRPDIALVGKGIIFDTGGTNLKPFRAMLDMHHDMCGSAVALALMLAICRLKLPLGVDCWLAITENRLSPQAYKSRDIVTAANGTTIEVVHTDAEGRMVLADTLVLAAREKPALILDFATLTGSCIHALTERYSGVFTNRAPLNEAMVSAGNASGERVWPFPMDEDFDEDLKSTVADVLQCSTENEGDHILAARFLQRFVPKEIPWVHVDLASATRKKGLAQVPGGPTGFGVRLALNLLVEQSATLGKILKTDTHGD